MRILHVADYLMPTMGYQEFILPKWNAKNSNDVHIITSDRYTPVSDYNTTWRYILGPRHVGVSTQIIDGVTVHRLPVKLEFRRRIWLSKLRSKVSEISPDVIFCHGTSSPLAFSLTKISRKLKIPLVLDNHMAYVAQGSGWLAKIYYMILRRMTKIYLNPYVSHFLGMSEESCDFMITQQGIDPKKVQALNFGVDTDVFALDIPISMEKRTQYKIPDNAVVVMQTGKLSKEKGTDVLSEAMLQPMRSNPNLWLVLVGGGNPTYLNQCLEPYIKFNISNRVVIIPFVPFTELPSIMKMADICVYPGESSLSCIESSACGIPVIITDLPWGQTRESLGIGTCYKTGDPGDLQLNLLKLIESPTLRQQLGEIARNSVMTMYSYKTISQHVETILQEAIDQYA
tara:strand:- start:1130 stop:2326 length:1197 start_codon:yes stop_codon:yes gene_type:complete